MASGLLRAIRDRLKAPIKDEPTIFPSSEAKSSSVSYLSSEPLASTSSTLSFLPKMPTTFPSKPIQKKSVAIPHKEEYHFDNMITMDNGDVDPDGSLLDLLIEDEAPIISDDYFPVKFEDHTSSSKRTQQQQQNLQQPKKKEGSALPQQQHTFGSSVSLLSQQQSASSTTTGLIGDGVSQEVKKTIAEIIKESSAGQPTKAKAEKIEKSRKIRLLKRKKDNKNISISDSNSLSTSPVLGESEEQIIRHFTPVSSSKFKQKKGKEIDQQTENKPALIIPQVRVVDGRIVLDEESLNIRRPDPIDSMLPEGNNIDIQNKMSSRGDDGNIISNNRISVEDHTNQKVTTATYSKHIRPTEKWSHAETERFFDTLQQYGLNFTMIAHLFPNRDRKQIYHKYKREERENKKKLEDALKNRKQIDMKMFQMFADDTFKSAVEASQKQKQALELQQKMNNVINIDEYNNNVGSTVIISDSDEDHVQLQTAKTKSHATNNSSDIIIKQRQGTNTITTAAAVEKEKTKLRLSALDKEKSSSSSFGGITNSAETTAAEDEFVTMDDDDDDDN